MSIFSKIYSRINFMNKPSTSTALGATNLNRMDSAIDELDNRIVTLDTTKLNLSVANSMVKDLLFDSSTGKLTVVFLDGTEKPYDTSLEKIAVNFRYDADTQTLIIVLEDGTEQTVDLSSLVTPYEFVDSDTIGFIIYENGAISANIKDGSITEDKLQPNYLADVKAETTKAESASSSAQTYSNDAVYNAQLAQSYAIGSSGGVREDEDTDNAKYYYEQTKSIATGDTATSTVSFTSEDATDPTEYTNVDLLTSGESHASLFNKVSTMFKNVRFLFKMLGTTDISAIGDGSVTGAINTLKSSLDTANTNIGNKQATITGGATTITDSNLTASRALISDANGKVAVSSNITTTELEYLDGVTSNIQNQLDGKAVKSNVNNQTQLLTKTQITTTRKTITFSEDIYNYNMIVLRFRIGSSDTYTYAYTIPYCCYDTRNHEIFISYNLSNFFQNVEFGFSGSTSALVRIIHQGSDSSWNNYVYLEIYGVGKR